MQQELCREILIVQQALGFLLDFILKQSKENGMTFEIAVNKITECVNDSLDIFLNTRLSPHKA